MTPSIDGSGVDTATIRIGLYGRRGEYTLSNSVAEAADVVAERNLRASELEGQ